jgi:glycosyltransferase involved in cell wall biosynthesis
MHAHGAHVSDRPLISVVMPVYNSERYVAEAIQSILAQTYPHFEFIIVDDGSTDRSSDIVHDYAGRDARIRPFFRKHAGRSITANAGIAMARGELVARMDADDIALPERFAIQLGWMRQTGVEICGSCVKRFGDQGGLLWFPETHAAIRFELLFRIGLLLPTVLMHTDILRAHPFNQQTHFEEYEMWTQLEALHRMGNVPRVLLKHRCHDQQSHVVESSAFRRDLNKFRLPYFHALFPDATDQDYAVIASIAEKEKFTSLGELNKAGLWLVRLAQSPDHFLRQQMAQRWLAACQRSAHLGLGCYRLYRQIASRFDVTPDQRTSKLWLACALRFSSNSRIYGFLAQVKRKMKRKPCLSPISL